MARIVFDLDGTLIDSVPDIHAIANALLNSEGLPPLTLDETRSFIGRGAEVFVQRLRAARGIAGGAHPRLKAAFSERYEGAVHLTRPYPGVEEALRALVAEGHDLGLCTNKPMRPCRSVLAHLGLDLYFRTVVAGDSLPVTKPDPAPLIAAFDALPEGPMIYVGDSEVDAETADRAGVPFLLFTEGYRSTAVRDLPHTASFGDFSALARLVSVQLRL